MLSNRILHPTKSRTSGRCWKMTQRHRAFLRTFAAVWSDEGRLLVVLFGEVVLEDAGGGCPAERSVGSVVIVEVDEPVVRLSTFVL